MTFRAFNKRFIEPVAQWTMIAGIVALCQPWSEWLHAWSVTICIVGFVTFLVSIHIPAPVTAHIDEQDMLLGREADHG